jgi:hypothetical protein
MRPVLLLLALSVSLHGQDSPIAALSPAEEAVALRSAESTGRAIYFHDHAAEVATDAAIAAHHIDTDSRLRGWVTEARGSDVVVTFIDQTPSALYRATVSDAGRLKGTVTSFNPPAALSSFEKAAAAARAVAAGFQFEHCAEQYNGVVLPPEDGRKTWRVYLLPAATEQRVLPIGGAYRVDTDGSAILSSRGFTRSCIALRADPGTFAFAITHLMDAVPTEVHVFWSLWSRSTLLVATAPYGTAWAIEDGRIKIMQRHGPN